MAPALVLYQPDIAQNTGTLMRLAACMGVELHIIHPTGFTLSEQGLRRAGMDYIDRARFREHDSYEAFTGWREAGGNRQILLTTKADTSLYAFQFQPGDLIVLGRESAGVPDHVARQSHTRLRIPMRQGLRSLNVAVTGAMALGEALRQTGTLPLEGASPAPIM